VGENANSANAETLTNRLGKVLRLNADGTIPIDNPFYNVASEANRAIWALGLRNPFTFAIQPGTGRMLINDVGESTWEEINEGVAGANFGWPSCEGACNTTFFRDPIYQYANDATTCAIAGGTFYNPSSSQFPSQYTGVYFFADLCAGWIRILDLNNGNGVFTFATSLASPVDLKVSADGSLYYLARGAGAVYRVQYTGLPNEVTLTLLTSPAGLDLTLDGLRVTTPYSVQSAIGTTHTLSALSSQRLNKTNYRFLS
jgi:glucose/arabinose dehydrogenase